MLLIGHALQLRFGEGKVALEMTIHRREKGAQIAYAHHCSSARFGRGSGSRGVRSINSLAPGEALYPSMNGLRSFRLA
jgi:hypothetical protein